MAKYACFSFSRKESLFFRVAFDPLNNTIEPLQKHGNDTKQMDPAKQFSVENIKGIGNFLKQYTKSLALMV